MKITEKSLDVRRHNMALYLSALVIMVRQFEATGMFEVKPVPRTEPMHVPPSPLVQAEAVSMSLALEDSITMHMVGLASTSLMKDNAYGCRDVMVPEAHYLALKLAYQVDPYGRLHLVGEIKSRCYLRAAKWVKIHEERIRKMASLLLQERALTAEEWAAV